MTRVKKIEILKINGEKIEYHYEVYPSGRRLIIDKVEQFEYNKTSKDQVLAGEHVDLLYWELTHC